MKQIEPRPETTKHPEEKEIITTRQIYTAAILLMIPLVCVALAAIIKWAN